MAHTYLLFDFGSDEEKAQQARHKLEGWKQAFRLDKKLLYKVDREESETKSESTAAVTSDPAEPASKSAKSSGKSTKSAKSAAKPKAKGKSSDKAEGEASATPPAANGHVTLLVRLYFSGHEKLTEQRWLERIPNEEPFKGASPRVVHEGESQFDQLVEQFDALE